jgi:hypothetical protein
MFCIFAGQYHTILTNPQHFCLWYVFLLGPHNAIVAMITVYSAECFATSIRGRGTGFVAAATKVAGIAAPYIITAILTVGSLWELSLVVGCPLFIGLLLFAYYAKETHTYESDNIFKSTMYRPVAPMFEHLELR